MERNIEMKFELSLSFSRLSIELFPVGDDLSVIVSGGSRPHIGCTVLAVPRPSLTGSGKLSCTSSVINVTGHKDEILCRRIAEKIACKYNCITVCSGGFHQDHLTSEEITELLTALETLNF